MFLGGDKINLNEWLPYDEVLENGVIVSNKKFVKIIKVLPISYELKSDLEKEAILEAYKLFLRTCNFEIQFIIQSKKENILSVLNYFEKTDNDKINLVQENYKSYIYNLNSEKRLSSKNFYILIYVSQKENYEIKEIFTERILKIKETLSKCGNKIVEINKKEEVIEIIKSFIKVKL